MSGLAAVLRLQSLGAAQVWAGDQPLALSGKSLALLMYLAIAGRSHRGALAELLWTDKAAHGARGNLRQELYRLRGKLPEGALHLEGEWVSLSERCEVDVLRFRAHLADGHWAEAAALACADFLPNLNPPDAEGFNDWQGAQSEQLRDESLRALHDWAAKLEADGQYREALAAHQRACELDDLSETHHQAVVRLLLALGQREAAQHSYARWEEKIRRELGEAPGPEMQSLGRLARTAQQTGTPAQSGTLLPLTGRENALYALSSAKASLILGEAGVGKTRLCAAFAPEPGLRLSASADLAQIPYAALAEALAAQQGRWPAAGSPELGALARLLPGVGAPGERLPEDRALLVQHLAGTVRTVLGGAALIAEDIHWLDPASLEVVAHLIRRGSERVVLSARPAELEAQPEHRRLLGALGRDGLLQTVEIGDLSEAQLRQLLTELIGYEAPLFSQRLYQATAGHPLFVLETLRTLRERGELKRVGGEWQTPYDERTVDYAEILTAPSVSAAIHERLARLGPATLRALQAAALSSEALDAHLIAEVSGLGEWESVEALEQAQNARLLVLEGGAYRFGHELYRRVTLERLEGGRRQLLHRALSGVLERRGGRPAQIAEHLELAGEQRAAWPYWREAARGAARLFAFRDAAGDLDRALACLPPAGDAFDLHAELVELRRHTDDQAARLGGLKALQMLAEALGDPERQAEAAARFASYYTEQDDYPAAVQICLLTLERLGSTLGAERQAALHLEAGAALACQHDHRTALVQLEQALGLTTHPPRHANVLYWMGHCAAEQGDLAAAARYYSQAVQALAAGQPTRGRVLTLCKLGQVLSAMRQFASARLYLEQAVTEARLLGTGLLRLLALASLGQLNLEGGQVSEARRLANEAGSLGIMDGEGEAVLKRLLECLGALPEEAGGLGSSVSPQA
jgi:DNA-binding SARP family transcriptional activator/Tfp pilus assembly protein PilF